MAAKKQVRARIKRSERKNIAVGQAHIKSTFNNTIVSITDPQGNVLSLPNRDQIDLDINEQLIVELYSK